MGCATTEFDHIKKPARKSFYLIKGWVKKLNFIYCDDKHNCTYSHEIKEGAGCLSQLVCPYTGRWAYDSDGKKIVGAIGRCNFECKDSKIRKAIELWISTHPNIY